MPNVPVRGETPRGKTASQAASPVVNVPIQGETPQDKTASQHMLNGWTHLQRSFGVTLYQSVKRARKLADASLRGKRR